MSDQFTGTKERRLTEFVLAWNETGSFRGGHARWTEMIRDDSGKAVSRCVTGAQPIAGAVQPGLPLADAVGKAQAQFAANVRDLSRDLAAERAARENAEEATAAAEEAKVLAEAEREQLRAEREQAETPVARPQPEPFTKEPRKQARRPRR